MIGHHDRQRIDALRQAAAKKGRVVRVVDQKTAVVPLHADTLADPNIAGRGTVPEADDTQKDSPTHGPRCSEANQHPSHACGWAIDRPNL